MALTEESTSVKADRKAGAKIETPTRRQLAEVPSRAAWVKNKAFGSPSRDLDVIEQPMRVGVKWVVLFWLEDD